MCACDSCAQIMKKCVLCRSQIELMVPITVCSGGLGTISEVRADVEEEPKPSTSDAPVAAQGPFMNNGGRDTSNDIQKLQQQLQDIKEQVGWCMGMCGGTVLMDLFVSDDVSGLFGSFEEYDFPVWSWIVSNVRRSDD